MSRIPPNDEDSEKAIIGACLMSREARDQSLNLVSTSDFYSVRLGKVFSAVSNLSAAGEGIDLVTVAGASGVPKNFLSECLATVPVSGNVASYCARVVRLSSLRKTLAWAGELSNEAWAGEYESVAELIGGVDRLLVNGLTPVEPGVEASLVTEQETEPNWLIPNLLEKQDRVIITGAEGGGKSTLCRMIAAKTAAGITPFSNTGFSPQRVLLLDLENSISQLAPQLKRLLASTGGRYAQSLWVKSRVQGLDLCTKKDADWLRGLLLVHRPSLLVVGPLYKMYRGSDRVSKASEEGAEKVTQVLDDLRVEFDCSLIIEAHAPHGEGGDRANWRPRGSTLFLGWPEFGIGMKPLLDDSGTVRLVRWRGDRVRGRDWPDQIKEGRMWPWESA